MTNLALIFPGQGSQKIGMGKEIYDNFPVARMVFEEIDEVLQQNLSQLIFSGDESELTSTENAQPALMAVSLATMQVILNESKKNINEICNFVAGHSLGEFSALAAAGSISIADCAKILRIRGNAMKEEGLKTKGAMAAVIGVDIATANKLSENAAQDEVCAVANDNCDGQIVLSGTNDAIDRAVANGKEFGARRVIKLPVSGAFHSSLIAGAEIKLAEGLEQIQITKPNVPLIANVTAEETSDPSEIKNLLRQQITSVVRWRESMIHLKEQNISDFVEIGSGQVLTGMVKRVGKELNASAINSPADIESFLKTYC